MNTDDKELDKYINLKIRELAGHHKYDEGKSWWTGTYEELTYFAKELIRYGYDEAKLEDKLVEVHSDQLDEAAEEYASVDYDCQDESNSFYNMVQVDAFKAGAEWQRKHDIEGRSVDIESGKEIMKMEMMKDEMNLKFKEGEFNDKGVEQLVQDYIGDDDIGDDLGDILDGFGRYLRDRGLLKGTEPANDDLEKYKEFVASELPQGSKVSQNGEFTINVVKTLIKDAVKMGVEWQKSKMKNNE